MVCDKHLDFSRMTAQPLMENEGWIMSHFPDLGGAGAHRGHLLLESRRHILELHELSPQEAAGLGPLASAGSRWLREQLRAEHVYCFRINDKVPHLHFHLIPRYTETPQAYWGLKIMEWPQAPKLSLEQIVELCRGFKIV